MSRAALIRTTLSALAAALVLAAPACSDDDSEGGDGTTSTTTSSSASTTDGSATMIGPVIIEGDEPQTVKVGRTLDVVTEGVTEVRTDAPEVLAVSQPRDDGSAQFNAGAEVVGPGSANLEVYGEGGTLLYTVAVTAEEA